MAKRIIIVEAVIQGKELTLKADPDFELDGLRPTGKMLVDSDQFSFIYLAEKDNEYTYIVFPESVWPALKKAIDLNMPAIVFNQAFRLELTDFYHEISYLTDNIKGNYNYGE